MSGNGLLAGLVAITAPSGFVNPISGAHHRPHRWRPGLPRGRFVEHPQSG